MKQILKSFYYSLIGGLPGLLVNLIIYILLTTMASISIENGLASMDYYTLSKTYHNIFSFIKINTVTVSVSVILFLLVYIVFYTTLLKIINPNFKLKIIKSKKKYFKILFSFIILLIGVQFLISFLTDILLLFINNNIIIYLSSSVITTAFWFFIIINWHKDGYFSDFSNYKNKTFKETRKTKLKEEIIKRINGSNINVRKLMFSLAAVFVISLVSEISKRLAIKQILLSVFIKPEMSISNYSRFFYYFVVGFFWSGALFLASVNLFLSDFKSSKASYFKKSIPVFLIVFIILYGNYNQNRYLDNIDYNKFIISEAKINNKIDNYNTLIIFSPELKVVSNPSKVNRDIRVANPKKSKSNTFLTTLLKQTQSFDSMPVIQAANIQCDKNTVKKVEAMDNYLKSKDYQSLLGVDYFMILNNCYKSNWDLEKYANLNKLAFEKINLMINGLVFISNMTSWANYDNSIVPQIEEFFNNKNYHFGSNAKKNIGYKLLHYGETELSKKIFNEAGIDTSKIDFTKPTFKGKISGKLLFTDLDNDNIKVGLFIDNDKKNKNTYGFIYENVRDKRLVASTDVTGSGNFSFDNLRNDEYYLGILVKEYKINEDEINIDRKIDKIQISENNSIKNIGEINITVSR